MKTYLFTTLKDVKIDNIKIGEITVELRCEISLLQQLLGMRFAKWWLKTLGIDKLMKAQIQSCI